MLWFNFSVAQKKIVVKYFENHKKLPIENVQIFLVTKSDTSTLTLVKGKIQLEKKMKDDFSLYAKVNNGIIINIGSYRRSLFEQKDEIIIGRITDFSKVKESWEFKDTFVIDKKYLITIPDSQNVAELTYSMVVKYVDVSANTYNPKTIPTYTPWYQVIKTKNN